MQKAGGKYWYKECVMRRAEKVAALRTMKEVTTIKRRNSYIPFSSFCIHRCKWLRSREFN
jgi:hypothetical protein